MRARAVCAAVSQMRSIARKASEKARGAFFLGRG